MKILIRKAHIIDPSSPFHHSKKDILITNGLVEEIAASIDQNADQIIEAQNIYISPGWIDVFANFNDPGFEFKETLETGARSAAAGGFTHVFVIPNTNPAIDTKSQVEYIRRKSDQLPVSIHPIGAVSRGAEGKDLAEMYDMYSSGAVAFSDGTKPIQSSGLLLKALQYVKSFDGVVIQIPDDNTIGTFGLLNEGVVSTRLGLPGKPSMSEELMVARDIKLARYAESKLHLTGLSSAKSLEYANRAKEGGIKVTCSVTPYHLYFVDEDLAGYDTNLKVFPPLRSKKDRSTLLDALKSGQIDCISTHHQPHEWDSKICEFEYAKPGMIGLESCFGVLSALGIGADQFVNLAAVNPRKIFNLPESTIQKGSVADYTLFSPELKYTFSEIDIKSKSKNSPFIGKELKGKVIGIINGEKVFLNS
ncbi:MAG TPA: dihydroorotase [Chitinophagaceae bacterium]|nr:dihydroorotase [Chitinophagaceae bacterium]